MWSEIEQLGTKPPPFYRSGFDYFTHNSKTYFLNGCFGAENVPFSNDMYLFDLSTKTWEKLPEKAKTETVNSETYTHTIPPDNKNC